MLLKMASNTEVGPGAPSYKDSQASCTLKNEVLLCVKITAIRVKYQTSTTRYDQTQFLSYCFNSVFVTDT